jgi:hypothetical protein
MVDIWVMNSNFTFAAPLNRVYPVKTIWKLLSVAFFIFPVFCIAEVTWSYFQTGVLTKWYLILVFVAVLIVLGFLMVDSFYAEIEITAIAVTCRGLAKTRCIQLNQISGKRDYVEQSTEGSTRVLMLESSDAGVKPIVFTRRFAFDDEFYGWFNSLPDLGAPGKKNK